MITLGGIHSHTLWVEVVVIGATILLFPPQQQLESLSLPEGIQCIITVTVFLSTTTTLFAFKIRRRIKYHRWKTSLTREFGQGFEMRVEMKSSVSLQKIIMILEFSERFDISDGWRRWENTHRKGFSFFPTRHKGKSLSFYRHSRALNMFLDIPEMRQWHKWISVREEQTFSHNMKYLTCIAI